MVLVSHPIALKYVVMEQLTRGLDTEIKTELFRQDFIKLDAIF